MRKRVFLFYPVIILISLLLATCSSGVGEWLGRSMQPELSVRRVELASIDSNAIGVRFHLAIKNNAPLRMPASRFTGALSLLDRTITSVDTGVPSLKANAERTFPITVNVPYESVEKEIPALRGVELIPVRLRGSISLDDFPPQMGGSGEAASGATVLKIDETQNIPAIYPEIRVENLRIENPLTEARSLPLQGLQAMDPLRTGLDLVINNKAGGKFKAEGFDFSIKVNGYELARTGAAQILNSGKSAILKIRGELSPRALGSSLLKGITDLQVDFQVNGNARFSFPDYDFDSPLELQIDRSGVLGIQ